MYKIKLTNVGKFCYVEIFVCNIVTPTEWTHGWSNFYNLTNKISMWLYIYILNRMYSIY